MTGWALVSAMLALSAEAQGGRPATASGVMAQVETQGAAATLQALFESPEWEPILDGIAGGGAG
jgi:hypothetical protein